MSRYRIDGEAPAGPELIRYLAHDTLDDAPVELIGLKRHVWLRPGAREEFAVVAVDGPAALAILGRLDHDGHAVVVRPRLLRSLRGVRLTPDEALAVLAWLAPSLLGAPFRGRLTVDDIWLDLAGHPRLMGLLRPEDVGLHAPSVEPPEIATGGIHANSDLYSLGAILYAAVAGEEPTRPPADLAQKAAVPPATAATLMRLLHADPAERAADLPPAGDPPVIDLPVARSQVPSVRSDAGTVMPVRRERWQAAVVVDTSALDPAGRARLAVLAGVPVAAVERAGKRGLPFVVGAWAQLADAERELGRYTRRKIPAALVNTVTPPIVQWALTGFLAAGLGFASTGYFRYAFWGAALALFGGAVARVRTGLGVARIGVAILDRIQAGNADDVAGEAATARVALLRADLPSHSRVALLEALDAAVDDVSSLAAATVVHPGSVNQAELRGAEGRAAAATAAVRAALAEVERGS